MSKKILCETEDKDMNFLLVPVIMLCAIVGTVGMLKLIQKFFPNAERIID